MTFSQEPLVDSRGAAFSRFVSRILEGINEAVDHRLRNDNATKASIAQKIGCDRAQLSRVLNGTTRNITLKTISDIMWATDFEPQDFKADPIESICPNMQAFEEAEIEYGAHFFDKPVPTFFVKLDEGLWLSRSGNPKVDFSKAESSLS